jgi:hypothetical protein
MGRPEGPVGRYTCFSPPLRSSAPLPPSADHAQSEEAEEEGGGFGDLLRTAAECNQGRYE